MRQWQAFEVGSVCMCEQLGWEGFLQDELNIVGDKSQKIKTIYVYTDFISSL